MDFSLSEDQLALRDLAAKIVGDVCSTGHLRAVAQSDSAVDLALWKRLADAGLVGIGLPESVGGGGRSWVEACIVLAELARGSAPVPGFAAMALAGPALAVAAPDLAGRVSRGETIVAGAIHEPVGDPFQPDAVVDHGALTGTKVCVMHGLAAEAFVVTTGDGLYLVNRTAPGVTVESQVTAMDAPDALVTFDAAPAERLGGLDAVEAMLWRGSSAACVMTAAACEAALELVGSYTTQREQFGKPIASFQAVSQRAGDAYIDTEAVRLTAWQAAWRMSLGLAFEQQLLTAKFWASEGGWRAVHAALHVHGGVGVDRDYPLHRHFLLQKQLDLHLGSATPTLVRLGRSIAKG